MAKIGRYDEAIAAYREATEIDPEYHRAWYSLGRSFTRSKKL